MDEPVAFNTGDTPTCRICRSEGTVNEPLFHPCRCSGSIGDVHQDCLVEWLSHSQKKHCELCKTPYRFTKLYDVSMPSELPWIVFLQQASMQLLQLVLRALRILLVSTLWLIILPYVVRWAWSWMFWFADAGWARDIYLIRLFRHNPALFAKDDLFQSRNSTVDLSKSFELLKSGNASTKSTFRFVYKAAWEIWTSELFAPGVEQRSNSTSSTVLLPLQRDASIFSSLSYISAMTPYPSLNRLIVDIFEGQLITCTVILAFVLVFLIREWVVQQQPVVVNNLNQEQQERLDGAHMALRQRRIDHEAELQQNLQQAQAAADALLDLQQDTTMEQPRSTDADAVAGTVDSSTHITRRPLMPDRETSSRATHIQRVLAETDAVMNGQAQLPLLSPPPVAIPLSSASEAMQSNKEHQAEFHIMNAGAGSHLKFRCFVADPHPTPVLQAPDPSTPRDEILAEFRQKMQSLMDLTKDAAPSRDVDEHESDNQSWETDTVQSTNDQEHAAPRTSEVASSGAVLLESPPDSQDALPSHEHETVPLAPQVTVAEVQDNLHDQPAIDPNDLDLRTDEERAREAEGMGRRSLLNTFLDWFWDDIQPGQDTEQVIFIDEDAILAPPAHVHDHDHPHVNDQDIAGQIGADAEAIEEAEDIDGLLELIGLRGPMAGLLQTSLFCLVMVICTVLAAVVVPYLWGKLVLGFIGHPLYFLITLPLQIASFMADTIVDITLFLGGAAVCVLAFWAGFMLNGLQSFSPRLGSMGRYLQVASNAASSIASTSGSRLRGTYTSGLASNAPTMNVGLRASVYSHLALRELLAEVRSAITLTNGIIRKGIQLVLDGKTSAIWSASIQHLKSVYVLPRVLVNSISPYYRALCNAMTGLQSGKLPLPDAPSVDLIDPSLVYWSSSDRLLAVIAGYMAIAVLAAIYVAADTPITRSPPGQRVEKVVRSCLRQAGGVFKVISIISIEMLVFPFYCGTLLDLIFLPLWADASLSSRLAFAFTRPYIFCFSHWFVGTCYMFHVALFVGMCRKILRKGVLWFIRDPDDPEFHPVRDVLERSVLTQLRKISHSALIYGALIIFCLGGIIWSIGRLLSGIFPAYWYTTEPFLELPVDMLLYNFATPLAIRILRPSEIIQSMYGWWLRKCARMLRLSHFLFSDRHLDEEGDAGNRGKQKVLDIHKRFMRGEPDVGVPKYLDGNVNLKEGRFVLTPCTDQFKPPTDADELSLHLEDPLDVHITNKDGTRNENFTKIYVPPHFRLRLTLFLVCLWVFSAFVGLCLTVLPLLLGRLVLRTALPEIQINDIYSYTVGTALLAGPAFVVFAGYRGLVEFNKSHGRDVHTLLIGLASRSAKALRSLYVYGFIGLVMPAVTAACLETYLLTPLHTFSASVIRQSAETANARQILGSSTNASAYTSYVSADGMLNAMLQPASPPVTHIMHSFMDFALAIFLLRLVVRFVFADRSSRAAEAYRRATEKGPFDVDVRIATRFLILPSLVVAAIILTGPPAAAWVVLGILRFTAYAVSPDASTYIYRYSYPAATSILLAVLLLRELRQAMTRWRARMKDDVYLVGERLHNFGEARPPVGSRSVMRRALNSA